MRVGTPFSGVSAAAFSPDSRSFAYALSSLRDASPWTTNAEQKVLSQTSSITRFYCADAHFRYLLMACGTYPVSFVVSSFTCMNRWNGFGWKESLSSVFFLVPISGIRLSLSSTGPGTLISSIFHQLAHTLLVTRTYHVTSPQLQ